MDKVSVVPCQHLQLGASRQTPHSPLWALRQRQPRRDHRHRPRMPRCRPASRRSTAAVGYRAGSATPAALPMPPLRRPHDRDRGVRTRLPAEVAAGPKRVRHLMSQTACQRRRLRSVCARPTRATIFLNPIQGDPCARRPLIPFKSRLSRLSRSLARSRGQACRSLRSSAAAPIEPARTSNRPVSSRVRAAAS